MRKTIQIKEPEFMRELHKVRVRLANKWKKMTSEQIIASINESGKWLKEQIASRSEKV